MNHNGTPLENLAADRNVDRLLDELHAKKKWLDMMIAGLEAAIESPHMRLVEAAERTWTNGYRGPKVDLDDAEREALGALASWAGSGTRDRPRRARRGSGEAEDPIRATLSRAGNSQAA